MLIDDIRALPAPLLATRDTQAIADALSVGRKKVATRLGGIGLVMETLGPTDGAALLDQLEAMSATVPAVKWAFVLINRGELDFGSPATRAMIDQLVPAPANTLLKAVAEVDDPIDEMAVRQACWSDDGVWQV